MLRLPRRRTASAPVALVACGALAACADEPAAPERRRPDVLVITIDTLRADRLGCYGRAGDAAPPASPHFDALARDGLRFEHCFAPRGQTGPSLASMLTGLYPSGHGVLDNFEALRDEGSDLVEHFVPLGYDVHAFVATLPIKKSSRAALAFQRFAAQGRGSWFEAKPAMQRESARRWDDAVEHALAAFLRARRGGERPFFAWAHFYDVHQPYAPPAELHAAFAGDYGGALRLSAAPDDDEFDARVKPALDERMRARDFLAPADARYVRALYDAGVRATDERLGRIVGLLRERALLDTTLVVVTSDHGEQLGDHDGFWFHGNSLRDSVLRIPLVVRGPGVVPGVFDGLAQNLDLLPTLLELAGGAPPPGIDGVSLAEVVRGARPEPPIRELAWAEWEDVILVARSRDWKYLLNPRGARLKLPPYEDDADPGLFVGCRELYDLAADPGEARDVWEAARGRVEELRRTAGDEYARRFAGLERSESDTFSPEELELLRQQGYVGAAEGEARSANYRLDPAACGE